MPLFTHHFQVMGGPASLHCHADDDAAATQAVALVEQEVRRIERKYSRYRDDSVVAALNRAAGTPEGCVVDAETARLLDVADTLYRQSEGRFDITSGVLREAWDFRSPRLPEPAVLADCLRRMGWSQLRREPAPDGTVRVVMPQPGMALDLGGIGKEYAADRAAAALTAAGFRHALVELAGDLCATGPHPDGSPWQVGISHPDRPGEALVTLALREGGLATSGDYQRAFVLEGRRYAHLLDARTGWPVSGLRSLSVQAPQCLLAGAVCTLGLLQGEDALAWLADCPQPWLAVSADGQLHGCLGPVEEHA